MTTAGILAGEAAPGHRGRHRAVFLDRDGVVNEERHYVHKAEDFAFVPGTVAALRALQRDGWRLVVVTNQGGIARGIYTTAQYESLTAHMHGELLAAGVVLDRVFHCPHHPEGTQPAYAVACRCRKPLPGMMLRAAAELDLDLPASVLVGDRATDLQAARAAGIGTAVAVRSGAPLDGAILALADEVHDCLADWARRAVSG